MLKVVPSIAGYLEYYRNSKLPSDYKIDKILREEIPEGKIYVEDQMSTEWHRHVELHGPGQKLMPVTQQH